MTIPLRWAVGDRCVWMGRVGRIVEIPGRELALVEFTKWVASDDPDVRIAVRRHAWIALRALELAIDVT